MFEQKIVKFETLESTIQDLIRDGVEARNFAYCPFSKFQVGAALLTDDGIVYKGCNIENSSFGASICAERTAYCKAVSEGKTKFKAISIIALQENAYTSPCGICRQFISEFGNVAIYIAKPSLGDVVVTSIEELLPMSFTLTEEDSMQQKKGVQNTTR